MRFVTAILLSLALCLSASAQSGRYTRGLVTIGTGLSGDSIGTLNVDSFTTFADACEMGLHYGTEVHFLKGTYTVDKAFKSGQSGIAFHAEPGAVFNIDNSDAVGMFNLTGSHIKISGFRINVTANVNDQVMIKLNGSKSSRVEDTEIQFTTEDGTTSNPMIGFLFSDTLNCASQDCKVVPDDGVIGMRQYRGQGNTHTNFSVTNNLDLDASDTFVGVDCLYGFQALDTQFCNLINFWGHGVGNALGDTLSSYEDRPLAMIDWKGESEVEDGHSQILYPRMEMCSVAAGILVEGVAGWLDIIDPYFGLANAGSYKLGDAAIKVTKNGSRQSARINIQGGSCHNYGINAAIGQVLYSSYAFVENGVAAIIENPTTHLPTTAQVNVTSSTNFHKNSGTWSRQPKAGEWIAVTGFATNPTNNGHFKVASADSDDITIDTALLTAETGSGDESVIGELPFEGSAIWLEYCSEVDIRGFRILDQRHQWGLAIDSTTVRGILIDGMTFHRGTGTTGSSVAPIRMPSATLLGAGTGSGNMDNAEGIAIVRCVFKGWGATLTPVQSGTWTASLTSAAPTITTTNAPYFDSGLADAASSGFTSKVTGTTMANLTTHINMDK